MGGLDKMKLFTQILNHKGASPLHSSHTSGDHESPKKNLVPLELQNHRN